MAAPGHLGGPGGMVGMPGPGGLHVQQQNVQHPLPHPQQVNPPTSAQQPQATHHAQQADPDPVAKFRSLLPRLKESLATMFRVGGHLFFQNANQDDTGTQRESMNQISGSRFEKSFEEFHAICDQIEIQLRLAQEVLQQDKDSARNTPIPVALQKTDAGQPEGHPYAQYLSTVRAQISCAKDIRDLLHEGLKNCSEHSHP